jgi:fucose 4-O-acetylase-like acetyltransferase
VDEQRSIVIDQIKGLAIILVVVGHVAVGLNTAKIIADSPRFEFWHQWIYAFHMPVFFLAAGALARRSMRRGAGGLIASKVRTLIYPYVLWTVILWSSHEMMAEYANSRPDPWQLLRLVYSPYMNLWFLYSLFLMFVLLAGMSAVAFKRTSLRTPTSVLPRNTGGGGQSAMPMKWLVVSAGVGLYVAAQLGWTAGWDVLDKTAGNFLYFAIGVVGAEWIMDVGRSSRGGVGLVAGSAGCFAVMSWLVQLNWYERPFYRLAPALLGIAGTFMAAMAIGERRGVRWVAFLGLMSLEIYLAHELAAVGVRAILARMLHVQSGTVHLIAGTAAGILLPVALGLICRRMNFPYLFSWPRRPRSEAAPMAAVSIQ